MSTMLAQSELREVVTCAFCGLVQYETTTKDCRRCLRPPVPPKPPFISAPIQIQATVRRKKHARAADITQQHAVTKPSQRDLLELSRTAIAYNLRTFRKSRSMTQETLATLTHFPRTYISRVENGALIPGPSNLYRLSQALGVELVLLTKSPLTSEILRYLAELPSEKQHEILLVVKQRIYQRTV